MIGLPAEGVEVATVGVNLTAERLKARLEGLTLRNAEFKKLVRADTSPRRRGRAAIAISVEFVI